MLQLCKIRLESHQSVWRIRDVYPEYGFLTGTGKNLSQVTKNYSIFYPEIVTHLVPGTKLSDIWD
jgi:hypothetical protein